RPGGTFAQPTASRRKTETFERRAIPCISRETSSARCTPRSRAPRVSVRVLCCETPQLGAPSGAFVTQDVGARRAKASAHACVAHGRRHGGVCVDLAPAAAGGELDRRVPGGAVPSA